MGRNDGEARSLPHEARHAIGIGPAGIVDRQNLKRAHVDQMILGGDLTANAEMRVIGTRSEI